MFFSIISLIFILIFSTNTYASNSNMEKVSSIKSNETFISKSDINIDTHVESFISIIGSDIYSNSTHNADVFFMGQKIVLDGNYNANVYIIGNSVEINGDIKGSLYTFTTELNINGNIENDFISSNPGITNVNKTSTIGKKIISNYKGDFNIYGNVGNGLKVSLNELYIYGNINGDIDVNTANTFIMDSAVINGNILSRGPKEADIKKEATINGRVDWIEDNLDSSYSFSSLFSEFILIIVIWFLIREFAPKFFQNSYFFSKDKTLDAIIIGFFSIIGLLIALFISLFLNATLSLVILLCYFTIYLISVPISLTVFSSLVAKKFNSNHNFGRILSITLLSIIYLLTKFFPVIHFWIKLFLSILGMGFVIYNLIYSRNKNKKLGIY